MLSSIVKLGVAALALAKPLVVDLETNWSESPHRVQVLETIAHYNSSAFFPLLSLILSHEEAKGPFTDENLYDFTIEKALEAQFVTPELLPILEADVALGTYTAAIESKFQTFADLFVEHQECENVLYYNGRATCDSGAVFALETDALSDAPVLDTDRIIGGRPDAPWAILYGDLSSKSFPVFHAHLLASALEGKINYVLRYKPSSTFNKQRIGGYGATAQVKRTDYLVVDDRDVSDLKIDTSAPNKLAKSDLPKLPFKVATHILKSSDRFAALKDVVLNLPCYLSEIKDVKISKKVQEDSDTNGATYFSPGTNTLLINGAVVAPKGDHNVFAFSEALREELKIVQELEMLGVNTSTARHLISSGIVDYDPVNMTSESIEVRYDYRSDAVIWINDLEKQQVYEQWSKDLSNLINPESELLLAQRNAHNLIVVVDMNDNSHLQLIAQVFQMVARNAPFRVGVVPIGSDKRAKNFIKVAKSGSLLSRQKYLISLLETLDADKALVAAMSMDSDGRIHPMNPSTYPQELANWQKKLGVGAGTIVSNGYVIPYTRDWIYNAINSFVADDNTLRLAIVEQKLTVDDTDTDIEAFILEDAIPERNDLLDPADPSSIRYIPTHLIKQESYGVYAEWPGRNTEHSIWVVGDLSGRKGVDQLCEALQIAEKNFTLRALPIVDGTRTSDPLYRKFFNSILEQGLRPAVIAKMALESYKEHIYNHGPKPKFLSNVTEVLDEKQMEHVFRTFATSEIAPYFDSKKITVVVDGRVIQSDELLSSEMLLKLLDRETPRVERITSVLDLDHHESREDVISMATHSWYKTAVQRIQSDPWAGQERAITAGDPDSKLEVTAVIDPASEQAQPIVSLLEFVEKLGIASIKVFLSPGKISDKGEPKIPNRYYRGVFPTKPEFGSAGVKSPSASFTNLEDDVLYVVGIHEPTPWVVMTRYCNYDLDNVILNTVKEDSLFATYELRSLLVEGGAFDVTNRQPVRGLQLYLGSANSPHITDTMVMANLGYFQLQAQPGVWDISLADGASSEIYELVNAHNEDKTKIFINLQSLSGGSATIAVKKRAGQESSALESQFAKRSGGKSSGGKGFLGKLMGKNEEATADNADINIFSVASGHLYERFLSIMTLSVMKHTKHTVKFWLIENFLSPSFKQFLPELAKEYGFDYELITYKWPSWLRGQSEKQREIWGYKILFLDVIFPQNLDKVMFIDSDQIVRTDLIELVNENLHGAPYGFTPMGDDREETEGFRFWKKGYWAEFLQDLKYHISALYVVDLNKFREIGAGDRLRHHYQQLSADPASLANLDQDLPNNLQKFVPIHSLDKDWLWCETWCSDEGLKTAKTIDLCNNPLTKEPKLDRARRQIPEWNDYDEAVASLRSKFFEERTKTDAPQAEPIPAEDDEDDDQEHYDL